MIRKLLAKLRSIFSSSLHTSPEIQKIAEEPPQFLYKEFSDTELSELNKVEVPAIKYDLDTGKVTLPDNTSPEERAELEAAMEEFKASLQQLNNDQFASFEDFLKPKAGTAVTIPFTTANSLPDNQLQVLEEMLNHKADTEHWNDEDFVEHLLGFHNQGYEFEGLIEIYNKMNERVELSEEDRKKLGQWYQLVSQELVYDV